MKRMVDIYSNTWSPEILWTYIINLEGNKNSVELNQDEIDPRSFELEALRLAVAEGRGDIKDLIAKVRE